MTNVVNVSLIHNRVVDRSKLFQVIDFEVFMQFLRRHANEYASFVSSGIRESFAQWVDRHLARSDTRVVNHTFRSRRMKGWRRRVRWANCNAFHQQVLNMRKLGVHMVFVDADVGFGLFVDASLTRSAVLHIVRELATQWGGCVWSTDDLALKETIQSLALRSVFEARDNRLCLLFGPLSVLNHAANSSISLTTTSNGEFALCIRDGPIVFNTLKTKSAPCLAEIRIQYGRQFSFSNQTCDSVELRDDCADDDDEFEPTSSKRRRRR